MLPELTIDIQVAGCTDQTLCISPGDDPATATVLGATWLCGGGASLIGRTTLYRTNIARTGASLAITAAHEVGHGMGLVHDHPGTLMAPYSQDQAPEPTPDDVVQWRSLR